MGRKRQRDRHVVNLTGNQFAQFACAATNETSFFEKLRPEAVSTQRRQHVLKRARSTTSSMRWPVIAEGGGLWRERYSSCCGECYRAAKPCPHFPEIPLRLLIIGHNPSEHTWSTGFPYSNPSNRFWKLLVDGGVLPAGLPEGCSDATKLVGSTCGKSNQWGPATANRLPDCLGIGITDLGCEPGSQADKYSRETMLLWRNDLFRRLAAHCQRAGQPPLAIAFSGVRQWTQLFEPPLKRLEAFGLQPTHIRPPRWPFNGKTNPAVFVLPSSSGRAVFTNQARLEPYAALGSWLSARACPAEIVQTIPP